MKTVLLLLICLCSVFITKAQTAAELQKTAHTFSKQGDYTNAVLVLNAASQLDPVNIEITKDLSLNYYYLRNNSKALEIIKPVLERNDVDDQSFQIAGNIYKQLSLLKECEKLFRKGIKKLPESGALYNELGELLHQQQDNTAIKQWEKGIEVDPNYSKNYYNACKYYFLTSDKVWSILYGEIFVNMEPLNAGAPEIKNIVMESYKNLFANISRLKENTGTNKFIQAFIHTMEKQAVVAASGINTASLIMIRARFILDWYQDNALKFPFKLFDLQKQLLQDGLFDAYNQWIFGSVENLAAYQNWTKINADAYNDFNHFIKGRIFKLTPGQYYHSIY